MQNLSCNGTFYTEIPAPYFCTIQIVKSKEANFTYTLMQHKIKRKQHYTRYKVAGSIYASLIIKLCIMSTMCIVNNRLFHCLQYNLGNETKKYPIVLLKSYPKFLNSYINKMYI